FSRATHKRGESVPGPGIQTCTSLSRAPDLVNLHRRSFAGQSVFFQRMDFEKILNRFTSFFDAQNLAWQRQGQEARRQGDRLAGRVKSGMQGRSGCHGQARIERRSEFKSAFSRSSQLVAVSGERLSAR